MQKVIRKAQPTFAVVRRICGKIWGLRPNMVHWLYTRVIRPSILHGALVWWSKVMQKTTQTQIDPYCSNGDALESDSVGSGHHGGGEDDTL